MNNIDESISIILSFLIEDKKDKYPIISKRWYHGYQKIKCKFCFSIYNNYRLDKFKCNNCNHVLEPNYIKEKRRERLLKTKTNVESSKIINQFLL